MMPRFTQIKQNTRTPHLIQRLESALNFRDALEKGAIALVEESRCRVRHLRIGQT